MKRSGWMAFACVAVAAFGGSCDTRGPSRSSANQNTTARESASPGASKPDHNNNTAVQPTPPQPK